MALGMGFYGDYGARVAHVNVDTTGSVYFQGIISEPATTITNCYGSIVAVI